MQDHGSASRFARGKPLKNETGTRTEKQRIDIPVAPEIAPKRPREKFWLSREKSRVPDTFQLSTISHFFAFGFKNEQLAFFNMFEYPIPASKF